MKRVPQSVDDLLLDYLDGSLDGDAKAHVEKELSTNALWRERIEELKTVGTLLAETKLDQPSRNFTESVMARLHQYPAQKGFSIRNGILLLVGVLVVVGIASVLLSTGAFDNTTTSIDLNQMEVSKRIVKTPLPSFEFNGKFIVNVIILLNLGLAWIVLDRTILRPFFNRRMHTGQ